MPAIATITSMTAGLDGSPTMLISSSPDTTAQGLGIARVGDVALPHKRRGSKRVHSLFVASGSPTVIVNGLAAATIGSVMTCGDIIATSPAMTVQVGV